MPTRETFHDEEAPASSWTKPTTCCRGSICVAPLSVLRMVFWLYLIIASTSLTAQLLSLPQLSSTKSQFVTSQHEERVWGSLLLIGILTMMVLDLVMRYHYLPQVEEDEEASSSSSSSSSSKRQSYHIGDTTSTLTFEMVHKLPTHQGKTGEQGSSSLSTTSSWSKRLAEQIHAPSLTLGWLVGILLQFTTVALVPLIHVNLHWFALMMLFFFKVSTFTTFLWARRQEAPSSLDDASELRQMYRNYLVGCMGGIYMACALTLLQAWLS